MSKHAQEQYDLVNCSARRDLGSVDWAVKPQTTKNSLNDISGICPLALLLLSTNTLCYKGRVGNSAGLKYFSFQNFDK